MLIKEINILDNNIEFVEEKKSLLGTKNYISKISLESIDKIEKLLKDNKLIGIALWEKDVVLYAIGFKNYQGNLDDIYDKIYSHTKRTTEVIKTDL